MHPGTPSLGVVDVARLAEQHELDRPSIVVEPLDGRLAPSWVHRPERPLYPASMIKVPLLAAAFILSARGEVPETSVIAEANMTVNDAPSPLEPGYSATLDELCELAITRSDNVATNQLFDALGRERASRLVRQ